MWYLLRSLHAPVAPRDGLGGVTPSGPPLVQQYRQAQATATDAASYQQHVAQGIPDDQGAAAVRKDLVALSESPGLKSREVATVKDVLARLESGKPLTDKDVAALRGVVEALGKRLLAADDVAMPKALREAVAASPNADRAMATYENLKAIQSRVGGAERLTDDVIRVLTEAVALPQSGDARGQKGIMGQEGALRAAEALMAMSPEQYARATALLEGAAKLPAPAADTERVLLLEALGAGFREPAEPIAAVTTARNGVLLTQLEAFAADMHGLSREALIARTNLTGVDGDGDSLKQVYDGSCAPTTIQMAKGDQDPLYAWQLTAEGSGQELAKAEQKEWLHVAGSAAVTAQDKQDYLDIRMACSARHTALDTADPSAPDRVEQKERLVSLRKYMEGGDPSLEPLARQALAELAAATDPPKPCLSMERVETIRAEIHDYTKAQFMNLGNGMAIIDQLEMRTGRDYEKVTALDAEKHLVPASLDTMERALATGQVVPIAAVYEGGGGHAMMMSDVRGNAPDREYLLSDPTSGKTEWVSEAALTDGSFVKQFGSPTTAVIQEFYIAQP